jgi:hypothetical protein
MLTLPKIVKRPARPYVYVPFEVRMTQMQKPAREGFPLVFGHIEKHGLKPKGSAFYNYRRIDMAATLTVEAGIAVAKDAQPEGKVLTGTLSAGNFMTISWHGHPDQLQTVTGMLIGWSRLTEQPFDMHEADDGDHFACRLEIYETDPAEEPDMDKWVTRLEFKLKD